MANRDISNFRTVTNVVAQAPDTLVPAIVETGQDIIRKSQEAKIVENLSVAQLELGKLSNDFQIQYEGDPFNEQGLKDFRAQRQGIIDKYGEGISPMFGRAWKDSAARLASTSDLSVRAWGYKQADVNTKQSIDTSMKASLSQVQMDAANGVPLAVSMANFATARTSIEKFGEKNIGSVSTQKLLEVFDEDAAKIYISEKARTNPVAALELMDTIVPKQGFEGAMAVVDKNEGGFVAVDGGSGAPAIYGINAKAHPSAYAEAKKITDTKGEAAGKEYSQQFYKKEYWDKNDVGSLPAATQSVVFDGLVNHTTTFGKKLVEAAKGGASVPELVEMRRGEYTRLKEANPAKYGPSFEGWMNRLDGFQGGGHNPEEWSKFRDAVEAKAINFQDTAKEQEILDALKRPNALLASGKTLSYAEIQQASGGMSEEAQKYFMHKNGYTDASGDGPAWKSDQKLQVKAGIYDQITNLTQSENIRSEDLQTLQDNIYTATRKGALSEDEGAAFLSQLISPVITEKEEAMSQYSAGQWNPFKSNVGFKELQDFYEDSVAIPGGDEIAPKTGKPKRPVSQAINATAKANLYDNYWNSLQTQAAKRNISVADIANSPDRDAIYAKAQQDAQVQYRARSSPVLRVQPSIPITSIKKLLDNPDQAGAFDEKFGKGAANRILGK